MHCSLLKMDDLELNFQILHLPRNITYFSVQTINLRSTRNLAIIGIALLLGLMMPYWITNNPEGVNTGSFFLLIWHKNNTLKMKEQSCITYTYVFQMNLNIYFLRISKICLFLPGNRVIFPKVSIRSN